MKKTILISILIFGILLIVSLILCVVFSFTYVKKNTDNLIKLQRDKLLTIIKIPNAVPPSNPTFDSISYRWDMETSEKEISSVNVIQTTAFTKGENNIQVVLEKTSESDSSIFDKVLPAVIADREILISMYSDEKTIELKNGKTGFIYAKIEKDSADKIIKITWEFDKYKFGENSQTYYQKLNRMPTNLLKILYAVQNAIILSLSS